MEEQQEASQSEILLEPMQPHSYPVGIKLIAAVIALGVLYGLASLPKYIPAVRDLKKANVLLKQNEYTDSSRLYLQVLKRVPTSRDARIGAAKALFSDDSPENDPHALLLLENINFLRSEWEDFSKIMPMQYQKYFTITTR